MGNYDIQQVCLNGHQITDSYNQSPEFRKDYCDKCGEKTIHKCLECKHPIKGDYHVEGVLAVGHSTPVPTHCENCGRPFPWAKNKSFLATKKKEKARESKKTSQEKRPTIVHNLLKLIGYSSAILAIVGIGFAIGNYWGHKEAKQEDFESFVEYLSIVKKNVHIIDVSSDKKILNPGDKCEIYLRINNNSPLEHDLWVGASAIGPNGNEVWNIREDKRITITASGITKSSRYLSFPSNAQPGEYDIQVNLWYGKISDPKQSELIASAALRKQISIEKKFIDNDKKQHK